VPLIRYVEVVELYITKMEMKQLTRFVGVVTEVVTKTELEIKQFMQYVEVVE